MNLSTAAKHMYGQLYGDDAIFFGAATDTRQLQAGQLFFAWKGSSHDAHLLLEIAASNGATAAVVEHYNPQINLPQIVVKDSQKALGRLAKAWRKTWQGMCFALTGSNGKTTLKEMLAGICSEVGKTHATLGNLNNHIGCPLTLMGLKPEHQFSVIEMGANHPKEISYLTHMTQPNVAILNNAGLCHLEGFINIEGVAKAKAEIFEGLGDQGVAIINQDDPFCDFWKHTVTTHNPNIKILSFGMSSKADIHLLNADVLNRDQPLRIQTPKGNISLHLQLLGRHNVCNCLAAIAASIAVNIPTAAIIAGLEKQMPVSGRLEALFLNSQIQLINDGYNANPSSLKAGIDAVFTQYKSDALHETWLILGEMRELGSESQQLHFECGQYARQKEFTRLFAIGEHAFDACLGFDSASEAKSALHFKTHAHLIQTVIAHLEQARTENLKQITLLTKGSFSMNMAKIIDGLKQHYLS